jgi:hypothetical protein
MSESPAPATATPTEFLDRRAEAYCRSVVWLWLIGGGVYAVCTGRILSLPMLLLFIPGIFVACGVAWAGFNITITVLSLVRRLIDRLEAEDRLHGCTACVLAVAALMAGLARLAVPTCLAVLYVQLARRML